MTPEQGDAIVTFAEAVVELNAKTLEALELAASEIESLRAAVTALALVVQSLVDDNRRHSVQVDEP